jgi:hypothetical protein
MTVCLACVIFVSRPAFIVICSISSQGCGEGEWSCTNSVTTLPQKAWSKLKKYSFLECCYIVVF